MEVMPCGFCGFTCEPSFGDLTGGRASVTRAIDLMRLAGYILEAVKGNTVVSGFSCYRGDGEWSYWDNAMMFRTMRDAQQERRLIPKDAWPEAADRLVIFPAYTE